MKEVSSLASNMGQALRPSLTEIVILEITETGCKKAKVNSHNPMVLYTKGRS